MLDALRFIAALSVIAYHYVAFNHDSWGIPAGEQFQFLSRVAAYGALGVPLFFVISGFVIPMSAWKKPTGHFVASRVGRLFPAYWVSVIASLLLFTVVVPNGTLREVELAPLLVNFSMTQEALGLRHLDGVYWTLWVEFIFYVMMGLLLARVNRASQLLAFAFLWPLGAAIVGGLEIPILSMVVIAKYAPLFAGEIALYVISRFGHNFLAWSVVVFNAILASHLVSTGIFRVMIHYTGQQLSTELCVLLALAIFAAVAVATVSPVASMGPKLFSYLGALTYPTYLMHENWGWWIISAVNPQYGKWAALAAAVGFTFIAAVLIERFVERPLSPKLRALVKRDIESLSKAD